MFVVVYCQMRLLFFLFCECPCADNYCVYVIVIGEMSWLIFPLIR